MHGNVDNWKKVTRKIGANEAVQGKVEQPHGEGDDKVIKLRTILQKTCILNGTYFLK